MTSPFVINIHDLSRRPGSMREIDVSVTLAEPLGTDVIRLFWLIAVGLVILGWWPGGRGPTWETGVAEEWLSPAQRRAVEQAEAEQAADDLPPANGNGADDAATRTRSPRKRKKKR